MIISEINEDELYSVFEFVRRTFRDTYAHHNTPENMEHYLTVTLSDKHLKKEYSDLNCLFYKGTIDDKLVGYLKLNINDAQTELSDLNAIEIERIYIDKNYHKKGLGAKLVLHSIIEGKKRSKSYLWLGVWDRNENAIGFYKRMGFEIFDTHKFQLGDEFQNDLMMKKKL